MLTYFVYYLLGAVQLAMLVRAILSWVAPESEGTLISFIYVITEPFIMIVGRVMERFGYQEGGMFNIPFFMTMILLSFLQAIVGVFL